MGTQLDVKKLTATATIPLYATQGAAGLDLYACLDEPLAIPPGQLVRIPTGIAVAIPDGFVGLVRDRSSLAMAGLHTVAGVIDSDYRGEVLVAARNSGPEPIVVRSGERVAQMLLIPCPQLTVAEVPALPPTKRGDGGFGSTGR